MLTVVNRALHSGLFRHFQYLTLPTKIDFFFNKAKFFAAKDSNYLARIKHFLWQNKFPVFFWREKSRYIFSHEIELSFLSK